MQKLLIKALAELVKHKSRRELDVEDENYMIIRPKVTGVLYFMDEGYLNGLHRVYGINGEPNMNWEMIKPFWNETDYQYKKAIFFESPIPPEHYMYYGRTYCLKANYIYAVPMTDFMYTDSNIEIITTVIDNEVI